MEAPSFDYSTITPSETENDERHLEAPVIESASASTARQTTDSNFAYVLTACVLGVIALLTMAFTWLGIGIVRTTLSEPHAHGNLDATYDDESWDSYADELDEFEDRLWDEYHSSTQVDA